MTLQSTEERITHETSEANGVFLPWDLEMDSIITAHAQLLATMFDPDCDQDGDVDLDDFITFANSFTG